MMKPWKLPCWNFTRLVKSTIKCSWGDLSLQVLLAFHTNNGQEMNSGIDHKIKVMWLSKTSYRVFNARFYSVVPTIFALSSGQGKCGVAVIRISGPKASEAIFKMTNCAQLPKPRMASLQHIKDPVTSEELDKGLVLWFPGPRSFTGEDSCEFQVHGGPAVVAAVLTGLAKISGFRPAEAGDFTKRAFFAGKMDLTEVEGLADLIHAETELQRKQALYQMEGNLSALYKNWGEALKKNLAHVEAYIDFSEEENIEDNVLEIVNENLLNLKREMENHLSDGRKGERLRDGIKTTIIGEPNAGKSSLLNAICQRPAAIVTPVPGTTRDIIETYINVSGFPIILTDTAGLRSDTSDMVEKEGISRALASIDKSDLVLLVVDSAKLFHSLPELSQDKFLPFLETHLQSLNLKTDKVLNSTTSEGHSPKFFFVLNKIDLLSNEQQNILKSLRSQETRNFNYVSCKTEQNFKSFMADITQVLQTLCRNPSRESPSITQGRHRHHLNKSVEYLGEYFAFVNTDPSISAQKLRLSLRHLGKIIGTVTSEEILDVIFKDFCIGK